MTTRWAGVVVAIGISLVSASARADIIYLPPPIGVHLEMPDDGDWTTQPDPDGVTFLVTSPHDPRMYMFALDANATCEQWDASLRDETSFGRFFADFSPAIQYPWHRSYLLNAGIGPTSGCRAMPDGARLRVTIVRPNAPFSPAELEAEIVMLEESLAFFVPMTPEQVAARDARMAAAAARDAEPKPTDAVTEASQRAAPTGAPSSRPEVSYVAADDPRLHRAHFGAVRFAASYAFTSITGVDDLQVRKALAVALPPRLVLRRAVAGQRVGLALGGSAMVGIDDSYQLVHDVQGGVGAALGSDHAQLAALVVLGHERLLTGATPATIDRGYLGGELAARLPLTTSSAADLRVALLGGLDGEGSETRVALDLITIRAVPVSMYLGGFYEGLAGSSTYGLAGGFGY